jgi:hypothetical protein
MASGSPNLDRHTSNRHDGANPTVKTVMTPSSDMYIHTVNRHASTLMTGQQ